MSLCCDYTFLFLKENQSLNEAICRKWSLQQMEEFAMQVRFLLYEETKQHDQIKKYCEVFLDIHKVSSRVHLI